jgi:hypothetical protein
MVRDGASCHAFVEAAIKDDRTNMKSQAMEGRSGLDEPVKAKSIQQFTEAAIRYDRTRRTGGANGRARTRLG